MKTLWIYKRTVVDKCQICNPPTYTVYEDKDLTELPESEKFKGFCTPTYNWDFVKKIEVEK